MKYIEVTDVGIADLVVMEFECQTEKKQQQKHLVYTCYSVFIIIVVTVV